MGDSALAQALEVIKQVGFPAAVAFWFMWRTDRVMGGLTEAVNKLAMAVRGCPHNRRDDDVN